MLSMGRARNEEETTEDHGPPFFVVGSARSGTTLLRLILNAHPKVAVPPESRFVVELYTGTEEVDKQAFLEKLASHKMFLAWGLPIESVRTELPDSDRVAFHVAVRGAFRAYARRQEKTRWGDKTPRYVEHISLLARLFPDARFVHLVRDGRNVALSFADVPFGPRSVTGAARLWAERVSAGTRSGRALEPGRYVEVRYENLVENLNGEIKDLCDFLELDFDAAMLDYTERSRDAVLPRASKYNPSVTKRPISGLRSWESSLPKRHVELFEAVAGPALTELGYTRGYPNPSAAARFMAALGRLGLPLGRLRRTRSG
jgi:hypothetical protein